MKQLTMAGRDYIALLFGILLLAGMIYLKRLGI